MQQRIGAVQAQQVSACLLPDRVGSALCAHSTTLLHSTAKQTRLAAMRLTFPGTTVQHCSSTHLPSGVCIRSRTFVNTPRSWDSTGTPGSKAACTTSTLYLNNTAQQGSGHSMGGSISWLQLLAIPSTGYPLERLSTYVILVAAAVS